MSNQYPATEPAEQQSYGHAAPGGHDVAPQQVSPQFDHASTIAAQPGSGTMTYPAQQSPAMPVMPVMPVINIVNNNSAVATATVGQALGSKSVLWAYVWLVLLGFVGAHKFYLGKAGMGVLYILTLGLLGVGLIYDLITLPRQVRIRNIRGF